HVCHSGAVYVMRTTTQAWSATVSLKRLSSWYPVRCLAVRPSPRCPTRRSSDLWPGPLSVRLGATDWARGGLTVDEGVARPVGDPDRKSTRLNSSHSQISYAVFCSEKKSPLSSERCCQLEPSSVFCLSTSSASKT